MGANNSRPTADRNNGNSVPGAGIGAPNPAVRTDGTAPPIHQETVITTPSNELFPLPRIFLETLESAAFDFQNNMANALQHHPFEPVRSILRNFSEHNIALFKKYNILVNCLQIEHPSFLYVIEIFTKLIEADADAESAHTSLSIAKLNKLSKAVVEQLISCNTGSSSTTFSPASDVPTIKATLEDIAKNPSTATGTKIQNTLDQINDIANHLPAAEFFSLYQLAVVTQRAFINWFDTAAYEEADDIAQQSKEALESLTEKLISLYESKQNQITENLLACFVDPEESEGTTSLGETLSTHIEALGLKPIFSYEPETNTSDETAYATITEAKDALISIFQRLYSDFNPTNWDVSLISSAAKYKALVQVSNEFFSPVNFDFLKNALAEEGNIRADFLILIDIALSSKDILGTSDLLYQCCQTDLERDAFTQSLRSAPNTGETTTAVSYIASIADPSSYAAIIEPQQTLARTSMQNYAKLKIAQRELDTRAELETTVLTLRQEVVNLTQSIAIINEPSSPIIEQIPSDLNFLDRTHGEELDLPYLPDSNNGDAAQIKQITNIRNLAKKLRERVFHFLTPTEQKFVGDIVKIRLFIDHLISNDTATLNTSFPAGTSFLNPGTSQLPHTRLRHFVDRITGVFFEEVVCPRLGDNTNDKQTFSEKIAAFLEEFQSNFSVLPTALKNSLVNRFELYLTDCQGDPAPTDDPIHPEKRPSRKGGSKRATFFYFYGNMLNDGAYLSRQVDRASELTRIDADLLKASTAGPSNTR